MQRDAKPAMSVLQPPVSKPTYTESVGSRPLPVDPQYWRKFWRTYHISFLPTGTLAEMVQSLLNRHYPAHVEFQRAETERELDEEFRQRRRVAQSRSLRLTRPAGGQGRARGPASAGLDRSGVCEGTGADAGMGVDVSSPAAPVASAAGANVGTMLLAPKASAWSGAAVDPAPAPAGGRGGDSRSAATSTRAAASGRSALAGMASSPSASSGGAARPAAAEQPTPSTDALCAVAVLAHSSSKTKPRSRLSAPTYATEAAESEAAAAAPWEELLEEVQ